MRTAAVLAAAFAASAAVATPLQARALDIETVWDVVYVTDYVTETASDAAPSTSSAASSSSAAVPVQHFGHHSHAPSSSSTTSAPATPATVTTPTSTSIFVAPVPLVSVQIPTIISTPIVQVSKLARYIQSHLFRRNVTPHAPALSHHNRFKHYSNASVTSVVTSTITSTTTNLLIHPAATQNSFSHSAAAPFSAPTPSHTHSVEHTQSKHTSHTRESHTHEPHPHTPHTPHAHHGAATPAATPKLKHPLHHDHKSVHARGLGLNKKHKTTTTTTKKHKTTTTTKKHKSTTTTTKKHKSIIGTNIIGNQASPTPATSTAVAPAGEATTYQQIVVAHHNVHRANHSAPNLVWDAGLASSAATIAASCVYAHNVNVNGGGYGQNIAAGVSSDNVSAVITDLFYNGEVNNFVGLYGQAQPSMANFENWGHFSQVVWKGTTSVGCATQDCSSGGLQNVAGNVAPYFTVCNYGPPGNYGGEYGDNIGSPLNHPTAQWNYDL